MRSAPKGGGLPARSKESDALDGGIVGDGAGQMRAGGREGDAAIETGSIL